MFYALPTTYIYNEKGQKVDKIVGSVKWDSEEIIAKLKKYLITTKISFMKRNKYISLYCF